MTDVRAGLDFDARYSVAHMPGVAWYLIGYAQTTVEHEYYEPELDEYSYETEYVDDPSVVVAVMVGDDRRHEIDADDLVLIDELDYCAECGQIGCTHDGRDRS